MNTSRASVSACVLAALLAGTANSQSFVSYTVQLGGDNHAAEWKAGQRVMYTPGGADDDQVYSVGEVVNWDVVVEAGGVHVMPGSPSDGFPIQGAANLVYDLELHQGTAAGPLVTTARFFSSINDGTNGDPTENAAFALSYNVGNAGPARVFDPAAAGGPYLGVYLYPVSHDYPKPDSPNVAPGVLGGMGAGYPYWDQEIGSSLFTTPGVGMALLPDGSPGLGVVPITEGQIDTTLMEPGTYTLRIIPGGGINVLRGDVDLGPGAPPVYSFAVAANTVVGDEISFVLLPEPGALMLLALGGLAATRRRCQ